MRRILRAALLALTAGPAAAQPWTASELGPAVRWGGRAVSIEIDPRDRLHALAASETGGLFRTRDGGESWQPVDSLQPFRLAAVRFVPGTDVVIVGAGPDSRAGNQGGIWRSDDGG